jgi:hypothetical protein
MKFRGAPRLDRDLKVENLPDGLRKLLRELALLRRDLGPLVERMESFKSKTKMSRQPFTIPLGGPEARAETDEPQSMLDAVLRDLDGAEDDVAARRVLFAILRDVDGALRDIRAMRVDVETVANNPLASATFRKRF